MPLGEPLAEFDIDPAAVWPVDDARLEPIFLAGPLWVDFDEEAQFEPRPPEWDADDPVAAGLDDPAEFDELDLERREEPADASPAATPQPASAIGVAGSVGVHLLVLLGLLTWSRPAGELAPPIAVQLVVMPEKAPDNPATPTEVGAAAAPPKTSAVAPPPPPPSPPAQQRSAEKPAPSRPAHPPARTAAARPVPIPSRRPPVPVREQTRPSPPAVSEEAHLSRPTAETRPWPKATIVAPQPSPASQGATTGPAMTREQYYAYLVALTRQHLELLPQSVIAGRSGRTLVSVQVLRDGTIIHIGIAESSGYPDIDARIAQMVAAVGRFPPLPAAFQGPGASLEFRLLFPDVYRQ